MSYKFSISLLFAFLFWQESFSQVNYLSVQSGPEFYNLHFYYPDNHSELSFGGNVSAQFVRFSESHLSLKAGIDLRYYEYHISYAIDSSPYIIHNDLTAINCYCRPYNSKFSLLQIGTSFATGYRIALSKKADIELATGFTFFFDANQRSEDNYYLVDSIGITDPGPFKEINSWLKPGNLFLPDYFSIPLILTGFYKMHRNLIFIQTGTRYQFGLNNYHFDQRTLSFVFQIGIMHSFK